MRVPGGVQLSADADMPKKSKKQNHGRESDPGEKSNFGKTCSHTQRAVDVNAVRKSLTLVGLSACTECSMSSEFETGGKREDGEPSLTGWLCLKCGHQGCGRNSPGQHALKHHNVARSTPHCLAVSLDHWIIWCYSCNDEVDVNQRKILTEVLQLVRKHLFKTSATDSQDHHNRPKEDTSSPQAKELSPQAKELLNQKEPTNVVPTVRGLSNLGNTCFFNAVMQNLAQTPALHQLLWHTQVEGVKMKVSLPTEMTLKISLPPPGPLASSLLQVLEAMGIAGRGPVVPRGLFGKVCQRAPRFKGFQQQDSQELLRYLLDGVRDEEIKRIKTGILEAFEKPSTSKASEETKKAVKAYGHEGIRKNLVDRVFGGELVNIITCLTCHTMVRVTEGFLDLSLPVVEGKLVKEVKVEATERSRERSPSPQKNIYQQRKAKRMAKKLVKNQRRQQKQQQRNASIGASYDDDEEEDVEKGEGDGHCREQGDEKEMEDKSKEEPENEEAIINSLDSSLPGGVQEVPREHQNGVPEEYGELESYSEPPQPDNKNEGPCEGGCSGEESNSGTAVVNDENEGKMNGMASADSVDIECPNEMHSRDLNKINSASGHAQDDDEERKEEEEELKMQMASLTISDGQNIHLHEIVLDLAAVNGDDSEAVERHAQVGEEASDTLHTLAALPKILAEPSLHASLARFVTEEHLLGRNRLLCQRCSSRESGCDTNKGKECVYTDGTKQILILSAPAILTLHLKRFQQSGFGFRKVTTFVSFPTVLDLAPFCIASCKGVPAGQSKVMYGLYGIVEHSGTMRGGHYTAYVKVRSPSNKLHDLISDGLACPVPTMESCPSQQGSWFHASDTHISPVSEAQVLKSQAYMLFYERLL
uniref:ubiquitin carboxyl-terminal hydrolase 16-like n=1 Tax=Myxine glutinosa TaxID=7769 RepID=UPI00358FAB45